ncbi:MULTISPECIES: 1-deoxy-D-xylulose-5-phosphate reductoisomerase [Gammaproteobacteria]|uniref:1-deoxy-D-xylulose-5-phosphate reductoisomerase n=1 Tax=Gammaproteobacteria TaxID=1236 RepID=UPI000DD0008F|nr:MULTISPECIES: 1-deoxy-D-xylulose-5-phosphate reductoisomerase [Gammaproteobacteria]RTE86999.1 1-deoxy-D-xylulose-5-phosphate reductoisomerase [Aliidiomarina sp. B3213]TCZ93211.1 1-deoxy-D-xylulose-5-phosphate reductoisomerase [Lysobacter sp. N42]
MNSPKYDELHQGQQMITILGATGSIGLNTIDVIVRHPESYRVFALTAHQNWQKMLELCDQVKPEYVVLTDAFAASQLRSVLNEVGSKTQVLDQVEDLDAVAVAQEVDTVMAAIVGAAGLQPTLAAVKAGKRVLLANKEALVMSGQFFMSAAADSGAMVLPVDSEHNAIFQALPEQVQRASGKAKLSHYGVEKILLTGSGGPFRELPLELLKEQTPEAACAHPNWSMGRKISVDSATMLNKGLEYIEARWLFNCNREQIDVLLHPQSVIHSMVQYADASVIAQMGMPDMRTPIAHTLAYPERIESGVERLDFTKVAALTFSEVDYERYPSLKIAIDACWAGQVATTTLNAANEVAVAAFLERQIPFTAISEICDSVVEHQLATTVDDIAGIVSCDETARIAAKKYIQANWG